MAKKREPTRREFLQIGANTSLGVAAWSGITTIAEPGRVFGANDRITAIHTHMYRNAPYGGWKQAIPADCDLQHVDWKAFEGEAPHHDWDPNRYVNWRFFWDYDGSNVFENMVYQVGFWYKALDLKIPRGVMMNA